jgi:hypothetical protein
MSLLFIVCVFTDRVLSQLSFEKESSCKGGGGGRLAEGQGCTRWWCACLCLVLRPRIALTPRFLQRKKIAVAQAHPRQSRSMLMLRLGLLWSRPTAAWPRARWHTFKHWQLLLLRLLCITKSCSGKIVAIAC